MKLKVLAATAVALLAAASSVAVARSASGTTIRITGTVGATVQDFQVYGEVHSPSPVCVRGRTVKIFSLTPSGPKLIDTDRASDNGFFFGGGDFGNQVNGVRVKAVEQTINGHLCRSDTDTKIIT